VRNAASESAGFASQERDFLDGSAQRRKRIRRIRQLRALGVELLARFGQLFLERRVVRLEGDGCL
jgi:hypothetical protein